TQGELLFRRTAVPDAIDEDRAADDRGRQTVARQQRDEHGRAERSIAEEARVDERIAPDEPDRDGRDRCTNCYREQGGDERRRVDAAGRARVTAEEREANKAGCKRDRQRRRAGEIDGAAAALRLPAGTGGPGEGEC